MKRRFELEKSTNNDAILTKLAVTNGDGNFDFGTSKSKEKRDGKGYYQLGDINISLRTIFNPWDTYRTAFDEDLTDCPLDVSREWQTATDGTETIFTIKLTNPTKEEYEVGGLGVPLVFNQILTDNTLDESHQNCVFSDPYIGNDAGYVQVTRLSGDEPTLLVTPGKNAHFEAYRPLNDDKTPRRVTFEGFYEWTIFSFAYAESDWFDQKHWNKPTSLILKPGDSQEFSLRFTVIDSQADVPQELHRLGMPVVDSVPGYTIHGTETAHLTVDSKSPVSSIKVSPANALDLYKAGDGSYKLAGTGDYYGYADVLIQYQDGTRQTINYFVLDAANTAVKKLADFHVKNQWLEDDDKYGRKHAFMTYDRDAKQKVLSERRTFISGVSDEVGAGPNLLMAAKNLLMPDKHQVHLLEEYVDDVLWGKLQNKEDYSIRASLYYTDENSPYSWASWDKSRSEETWRAYNYPHQATIYWIMYRLARNYDGLVTNHDWQWYLEHAYQTVMAMHKFATKDKFMYLEQFGLMVGSAHLWILKDLEYEGWNEKAESYEEYMRLRYTIWASLKYPYGSEMPWDSTGQEEIYVWCDYFGDMGKAKQTVDAVKAYTPSIPNWGYNGAARRYFDSAVYGKREEMGRLFGHYGSPLNAIPLLMSYKEHHSDDLYLLKVGYAASTSALTTINPDGFGSMGYLANPDVMDFEPYTGDYGQSFYGYMHEAGQFVHFDPQAGWLSFGGEVEVDGSTIVVTPTDAFHRRLFIHGENGDLEIKSETAPIKNVLYDLDEGKVIINFAEPGVTPKHLRVQVSTNLHPVQDGSLIRGAYEFDAFTRQLTFKL